MNKLLSQPYRRVCAILHKLPLRRCTLCDTHGLDNQNVCHSCALEMPANINDCTGCARAHTDSARFLCANCEKSPPPWQRCFIAMRYEIPADYLVKRFKYGGDRAAGRAMAEQMWTLSASFRDKLHNNLHDTLFVPVPLHKSRLQERGFNQAEYLASYLAAQCGTIVVPQALIRTRPTCPQVGLSKKARRLNMKNSFRINTLVANKHVVLVDDVLTTGSTARACSHVLMHAGAVDLTLWCYAHGNAPAR